MHFKKIFSHWLFQLSVSLSIGALFLSLAFRQTHIDEVTHLFSNINYYYIISSQLVFLIVLALRIFRWQQLLNQIAPLTYKNVSKVLLVGYAINNLLPARLGELFRADYCKRQYGLSRTKVLGSIVLERLSDSLIVLSCLGIGTLVYNNTGHTNSVLQHLLNLSVLLFGSITLFLLWLGNSRELKLINKWPIIAKYLNSFRDTIRIIRSRLMLYTLGLSLIIWTFEILSICFILNAVHIELGMLQLLLIVGIVSLSTLLPSPPGFLGTLQFAFTLGVSLFGYTAAQGIVAASAFQLFLIGTVTLSGISILLFDQVRKSLRFKLSRLQ